MDVRASSDADHRHRSTYRRRPFVAFDRHASSVAAIVVAVVDVVLFVVDNAMMDAVVDAIVADSVLMVIVDYCHSNV